MGNEWTLDGIASSIDAGELDALKQQFEGTTVATQRERMNRLRAAYAEQGIALILGAGVSMDAGVPSWSTLLSRLTLATINMKLEPGQPIWNGYLPFASVFQRALPTDALVAAHYAKRVLQSRGRTPEDFLQVLRAELYRSAQFDGSPLLATLANLCRGSQWDHARGIREVITYNFDVLFEQALTREHCSYHSPGRNTRAHGHRLPIYHPHGVLHPQPKSGDWAILAEDDYHAEFASPHSWSNIVQLNAFSQLRCVFVGLSMTDPNIRRLLSAARGADQPQHFAFLPRSNAKAVRDQLRERYPWSHAGSPSDVDLKRLDAISEVAALGGDTATDVTLDALGVQVIWFEGFDKLPGLLASIRPSAEQ